MCVICCLDFEESSLVNELNCQGRHIFHHECIIEWMKTKTICPLCSQEVTVEGLKETAQQQKS